jgi:hypothetical protein
MFDNFNIEKYKQITFPKDNSLRTLGEIKKLKLMPLNKVLPPKYDDIGNVFQNIFSHRAESFPYRVVQKLIEESEPVIKKIKDYHNRPRPNVNAKKFKIDLDYLKMKSAQTPSFPSGHSAQSKLVALALTDIYPHLKREFDKAAENISNSRIVARVHYESDKTVGEKLGADLYNHIKDLKYI